MRDYSLEELMALMRKHGAQRVAMPDVTVELFPAEPKAEPLKPQSLKELFAQQDLCKCGHDETAHGPDGLCLLGCDAEPCRKHAKDEAGKR